MGGGGEEMNMGRQVVQLSSWTSLNLDPHWKLPLTLGQGLLCYSFLEMPFQTLLDKTHFLVDKINNNICIALLWGYAGLSI